MDQQLLKEFHSKKPKLKQKLKKKRNTENLSLSLMISHFLVEQLDLPLIGEIYTPSIEPICVRNRKINCLSKGCWKWSCIKIS